MGGASEISLNRRNRPAAGFIEQLSYPQDDLLRFERFHHESVARCPLQARLVEDVEGIGEEQHRDVPELLALLDEFGDVVPRVFRQPDVNENHTGMVHEDAGDGLLSVIGCEYFNIFTEKRQFHDSLNRDAGVGNQQPSDRQGRWSLHVRDALREGRQWSVYDL